jgi:hypothetical protein
MFLRALVLRIPTGDDCNHQNDIKLSLLSSSTIIQHHHHHHYHHHHHQVPPTINKSLLKYHIINMLFRATILYVVVGLATNQVIGAAIEAPRDVAAVLIATSPC